jgi:signal transduction histidine kinase
VTRLQGLAARVPTGLGSIRFRIALTTSAVLFLVTAVLVGVLYIGLSLTLSHGTVAEEIVVRQPVIDENGIREKTLLLTDARNLERRLNDNTLATMRNLSLGALGVLFVLSLGAGWVVAGRVLRPIDHITAVAREIQATSLSRRIALEGPDDELKRLADTFDGMLGRIEAAFSAQRRFIADASHELRNPLAIIQTNLDLALGDADPSVETMRGHALVVRRASDRMTGIVGDLLSLARLETPTVLRKEVDLAAVAGEAGDEFEALAAGRGIGIERFLEPGLVVVGDPSALRRAIANLLDNAVRLAPAGSTIQLRTQSERDWVSVSVTDEGPGIAAEDQRRIFDRFWRGDRSRPGGGLGLAIVKQTVEAHGGTVLLASAPGVGSAFYLCLPARAVVAA